MPERPGRVAERHPGLVGNDIGDLGGTVTAVLTVDVLDHFFAAAMLDVQVDVGRAVPASRKEPLEQQAMPDGDRRW